MKVNIICSRLKADRILPRLARTLAENTGWLLNEKPVPGVDINYFFPYIEYQGWTGTKTAGWFTHRDTAQPDKLPYWDRAAKELGLRTTSARIYENILRPCGLTKLVTVPLDLEKFKPISRPTNQQFTLGVSGYTYPGGRKGEGLVAKLMQENPDIKLIASGRGWPCETKGYGWNDMQTFFQGLDAYLCASTLEGIPYPPLEAMACGIPVIIPRRVGLLDELPKVENMYRYEPGDYAGMVVAIRECMADLSRKKTVNINSLRGVVERFTVDAWVTDHIKAFEELIYGTRTVIKTGGNWRDKAGVYYVAYGDPARDCVTRAIQSFKRFMPDVPVALVSDKPLGAGEDILIQNKDEDIGGRSVKTKIYDLAPQEWEYVLYLDADTEITADISFLFDLLADGWEALFCVNPAKYALVREMSRPDNKEETKKTIDLLGSDEILQLNGGVFGFRRNENTARFMRAWHQEWAKYGARDQGALTRVLYTQPIRIYVLGNEWNTVTRYIPPERTAGILHYPMQARRWKGRINGRLDGTEAWAAVHPGNKK